MSSGGERERESGRGEEEKRGGNNIENSEKYFIDHHYER